MNAGHGHVRPRADGQRARCGGPALCEQCIREQAQANAAEAVTWVCAECGARHGRYRVHTSTWHNGRCSVCGRESGVTAARDFGLGGWSVPAGRADIFPMDHIPTGAT